MTIRKRCLQLLPHLTNIYQAINSTSRVPPCFTSPVYSSKTTQFGSMCYGSRAWSRVLLTLYSGSRPFYNSGLHDTLRLPSHVRFELACVNCIALQFRQASSYPYLLCRRRRLISPSMGGGSIADEATSFPIPIHCHLSCISVVCQSYSGCFQVGVVDRPLAALHVYITFIMVFRHNSPYHTSLSLPAWHFVSGILFLTFQPLQAQEAGRDLTELHDFPVCVSHISLLPHRMLYRRRNLACSSGRRSRTA